MEDIHNAASTDKGMVEESNEDVEEKQSVPTFGKQVAGFEMVSDDV